MRQPFVVYVPFSTYVSRFRLDDPILVRTLTDGSASLEIRDRVLILVSFVVSFYSLHFTNTSVLDTPSGPDGGRRRVLGGRTLGGECVVNVTGPPRHHRLRLYRGQGSPLHLPRVPVAATSPRGSPFPLLPPRDSGSTQTRGGSTTSRRGRVKRMV